MTTAKGTALAEKVTTARTAQRAGVSTKKTRSIFDLIQDKGDVIARALPQHVTPERFVQVTLNQVRRTPKLQACDAASLLGAVYALAQVGLEPDGRNAHLVPFGKECTPIIDYRGYIELAARSGRVEDLYAEVVHEKDHFQERRGLHRDLVHEPYDGDDDPGQLVAAYAVVHFTTGGFNYVVLKARDVNKRKAASKSSSRSDSPWKMWPERMWAKSAVRALSPYLPYSPELARAEALDSAIDRGLTFHDEVELDELVTDVDGEDVDEDDTLEVGPGAPANSDGEPVDTTSTEAS